MGATFRRTELLLNPRVWLTGRFVTHIGNKVRFPPSSQNLAQQTVPKDSSETTDWKLKRDGVATFVVGLSFSDLDL